MTAIRPISSPVLMSTPNDPSASEGIPELRSSTVPEFNWESTGPINLRGQTILVVFNPAARDGRIGQELPQLQRILERAGARVIPVETLPEESARRERIRDAATRALVEGSSRIYVLPYGGDGTIWESVGEVVKATGVSFEPNAVNTDAVRRLSSQVTFFLAKKGTASDNAVQVSAPSSIRAMPRYLRGAVELPFWFPTVETVEAPGIFEVAGHNFGLGASGYLFARRMENIRANPGSWLNQGLISYLRLMPHAAVNRYGLLGFDIELRHFNGEGGLIREATMLGAEVITTPNRIMAGVGGVPGAWGETKIVILPPALSGGLLSIGEYIFRGVATKLGWNKVGPSSSLRSLSEDRQWLIRPGERVDVRLRVPQEGFTRLFWDFLRSAREMNLSWRFFKPGPEVPAAGEALPVPGQRNGDVVAPSAGFTVRSPNVPISMLAHPDSLAVRLARASAFINGEKPLISDQQVTSFLPENNPMMWGEEANSLRVRTPFISRPRLRALLDRNDVPRQYGVDLIIAARGYRRGLTDISLLHKRETTIEGAMEFIGTEHGARWIAEHQRPWRAFGERVVDGGVPLVTGIGAMFAGEALADRLGLDPVRDRELRFGLVTYAAHAVQSNVRPLWEVAANRMLGRPYDFLQTRAARAAGEAFTQWSLEYRGSLSRALSSSWMSQNLGMEMGLVRSLPSRLPGWGLIPLRAAWNMGEGLIFSRLTESLVRGLPDDSLFKRYAPTAAFFAPDVLRMVGAPRLMNFMESRAFRFAGRAFAVGYISDMAFTGIHRAAHGGRADYELYTDARVSARRRETGDIAWYSWRQVPHLLAPSLANYMDSHDFLFGPSNELRREMQTEDQRSSALIRESAQEGLAWLPTVLGGNAEQIFSTEIRLSPVERDMAEQLSACRGGRMLRETAGFEETVSYLRHQFRGVVRTNSEARRALARIYASQLQQSIAALHHMPFFENSTLRGLFDASGRLRPGRGAELQRWIETGEAEPMLAGRLRPAAVPISS